MEKYIKALLIADNRAIVPQFGAFQALREETVSISFNPYLNFDDEKLTAIIANDKGIAASEASDFISKKVDEYNHALQDNGSVTVPGIGVISKAEDGTLMFTQDESYTEDNAAVAATGAPAATAGDENAQGTTTEPAPAKKEKKGFDWKIIILILLLLLLLFGAWYCFVHNKDNAIYKFFNSAPAVESVTPAPAPVAEPDTATTDSVKVDSVAAPAPAVEAKPAPTEARRLTKRYNVIVGSYKDEAVAIKRVKDLHAKGFTEAFVGMRKDYFVAVIGDYDSVLKAEKVQEEIVDGPYHIESWITNSGENE